MAFKKRGGPVMARKSWLASVIVAAALAVACSDQGAAPTQSSAAASPCIYVVENGTINGLDPARLNFNREDLKQVDFVNMAYLVVHPRGTLMVYSGGMPDSVFKADGAPVVEGVMTATKPLLPQLKAAGYEPSSINYFVLSHYHSDHTGN